jgi:lipoprotein-anchoring transpeptidase ErfK/SrfK
MVHLPSPLQTCQRFALALFILTGGTLVSHAKPRDSTSITRLQIYLDNHDFGPGPIDGQYGKFTQRALAYYNAQKSQPKGEWKIPLALAEREVPIVFVTHRITKADIGWIGRVPNDLRAQAVQRGLPYTSLIEFLCERYHTDGHFLQRLNPRVDLEHLKPGDLVIVPNVRHVFRIEAVPVSKRYKKESDKSSCYILIDTTQKMASIYRGTQMLAAFPITHVRPQFVPKGRWKIQSMVTTPTFRWDERMLKEGQRSEHYYLLPPGPNNPVGILWAGINKKGIGLHGTNSPEKIGRTHSAGCIRFCNWDAIRLPSFIRPGSEVIVR